MVTAIAAIIIVVLLTLGYLFFRKFVNDLVDNSFNKAGAAIRNKKYGEMGEQLLADRYRNTK